MFAKNGKSQFYLKMENKKLSDIAKGLPRNIDGQNCLVAFSGGRDSSYGLYKLKELGFNPIAYTYDWGMVNKFGASESGKNVCGALNIEHIWISADIPTKRRYVRQTSLFGLSDLGLFIVMVKINILRNQ